MRFFRNRAFSAANARVAPDVLRDVRVDLPADPVPAERAGLLAARGRPAHAAVDGHADDRRPDRGRDLRPHRRPAADGCRADAAGDRARLAGGRDRAGPWPTATMVAPFVLAGVGMGLFFAPDGERRAGLGRPRRGRQGLRREQRHPRAGRRVRRRGAGVDLQPTRVATDRPSSSPTASRRRCGSGPWSSASVPSPRCSCPRAAVRGPRPRWRSIRSPSPPDPIVAGPASFGAPAPARQGNGWTCVTSVPSVTRWSA